MTKKQLYIIVGVLSALLVYVLFMPTGVSNTTVEKDVTSPEEVQQETVVLESEVTTAEEEGGTANTQEKVTLEGTFVGLLDGEDPYQKEFKYLLLNDGVEVLRIDLRPLIGYSDINVIEKLGVDRGDTITVTGTMKDDEFVVETIE